MQTIVGSAPLTLSLVTAIAAPASSFDAKELCANCGTVRNSEWLTHGRARSHSLGGSP